MATAHSDIPIPMLAQVAAGRTPPLEPLTITQVEQMMEHGILMEGAPIELIDGLLIRKDRSTRGGDPMTHHPRHAACVSFLQSLVAVVAMHGCHLRSQLPIALSQVRAPEPDLAIVRGKREDYRNRHPAPSEIVVLIEVADSSLDFDRTTKQRLYAEAGIATYWIVNLIDDVVELFGQPDPQSGKYQDAREYRRGEVVEIQFPAGTALAINVSDILS